MFLASFIFCIKKVKFKNSQKKNSTSFNPFWRQKIGHFQPPNVRNVWRTLEPNFEHLRAPPNKTFLPKTELWTTHTLKKKLFVPRLQNRQSFLERQHPALGKLKLKSNVDINFAILNFHEISCWFLPYQNWNPILKSVRTKRNCLRLAFKIDWKCKYPGTAKWLFLGGAHCFSLIENATFVK